MIKLNEVPNNYEPRKKIISKLKPYFEKPESNILMHSSESGFLCGLLGVCRPKKILELGIAAGGSTSIILQTLEDIDEPYEMYSVDYATYHWKYTSKNMGFMAAVAKEKNILPPPPTAQP